MKLKVYRIDHQTSSQQKPATTLSVLKHRYVVVNCLLEMFMCGYVFGWSERIEFLELGRLPQPMSYDPQVGISTWKPVLQWSRRKKVYLQPYLALPKYTTSVTSNLWDRHTGSNIGETGSLKPRRVCVEGGGGGDQKGEAPSFSFFTVR